MGLARRCSARCCRCRVKGPKLFVPTILQLGEDPRPRQGGLACEEDDQEKEEKEPATGDKTKEEQEKEEGEEDEEAKEEGGT